MSEIQEEAYTELCLENEGLRKALSIAHAEYRKLNDKLEHALRTIEEMSLLLGRAADALKSEHEGRPVLPDKHPLGCSICNLIAELRKAAE
jgi:hypothetical protein